MFINGWPPLAAGFQKNGSQFYWWNPNVYHVSWSCCILIAICCNKNTSFLWGFITHRSSDCHFPGLEHLSLRGLFGARSCHLRRNHPRIFPKWWMNQWENEGLTNGFSPANDGWTHGKPKITIKSKGLRVKKAPLFDPFLAPPRVFLASVTLPATGARLLSAFPFQFQLHLQLTVGGLVGAAQLAQVFNLFGQLGDRGWEDTSWILCVLKETKKMETAGSWLSHKL
jgi:hypothetical protein